MTFAQILAGLALIVGQPLPDDTASTERQATPWSVHASVGHIGGSGLIVRKEYLREQNDYVVQSWWASGRYLLDVAGQPISIAAHAGLAFELTSPSSQSRALNANVGLAISDERIFREKLTGITIQAGTRVDAPILGGNSGLSDVAGAVHSRGTLDPILSRRGFLTLRGWAGLSDILGPVELRYRFAAAKHFNSSKVHASVTVVRRSVTQVSAVSGFANTSFVLHHQASIAANVTEFLSTSYALGFVSSYAYDVSSEIACSAKTNLYADCTRGRSSNFNPTLVVDFHASELIEPLSLRGIRLLLSVGIQALHPVRTPDNKRIIWPLFYNMFSTNRAANGYASMFVKLSGGY